MLVQVDESARSQIEAVLKDNPQYVGLRVGLRDGGCSGYMYELAFETEADEDDETISWPGGSILVHRLHLPYLVGSVVTWATKDLEEGFAVTNPNASRFCGCGESFAV